MTRLITFGNSPTAEAPDAAPAETPDWVQANPSRIEKALARALALPAGGWYVVDASEAIGRTPRAYAIDGHELVLWRAVDGSVRGPVGAPPCGAPRAAGAPRGRPGRPGSSG